MKPVKPRKKTKAEKFMAGFMGHDDTIAAEEELNKEKKKKRKRTTGLANMLSDSLTRAKNRN
jgi:hypothetical protein